MYSHIIQYINNLLEIKYKLIVVLFFIVYFFMGISIFKDYGISWDEETNRANGVFSAVYINKKLGNIISTKNFIPDINAIPNLSEWKDKDYGVFFELILIASEFILSLDDSRDIFLMRHFLTFFMFWISIIFYYLLVKQRFKDWKMGLLGCLFLTLSPRIFADSFYNSKDIVLLSFAIINTFTLINFLKYKTFLSAFLHAISSALLINTRIVGIYIPCITFLFIGIEIFRYKSPNSYYIRKIITILITYLLLLISFSYMFWPYLWENPVHNFIQVFINMSKFRWHNSVLFEGAFIKTTELPWYYIPLWIIITTPVLYILLFLSGILYILPNFLKHPLQIFRNEDEKSDIIFLLLFFSPLFAVIFLKSVLYDGWRQMYFIYPPFLLVALIGFSCLIKQAKLKLKKDYYNTFIFVITAITIYSICSTSFFMIKYHPHQNVYFNFIAGKDISKKFELDYWGLSYKQGLEYILNIDKNKIININAETPCGERNVGILNKRDRERINFVSIENATYFISNYRFTWNQNQYYKYNEKAYPYINKIFSIQIKDYEIIGIYKLQE